MSLFGGVINLFKSATSLSGAVELGTGLSISGGELVGVAASNPFTISNGALTISNPEQLLVQGAGQTLTQLTTGVEPVIVQSVIVGVTGSGTCTATLPGPPTLGNTLIAFAQFGNSWNGFTNASNFTIPSSTFWLPCAYATVNAALVSNPTISCSGNTGSILYLAEISGCEPVTGANFFSGSGSVSGDNVTTGNIASYSGGLQLTAFGNGNGGQVNFSAPTPAGASILIQQSQTPSNNNWSNLCVVGFEGTGNNVNMGVTYSAVADTGFATFALQPSVSSAEAVLTVNQTTATTQPVLDNTTSIATNQFVNQELIRSKATELVTVTGGTYNLASLGTGLQLVVLASGGVVNSILTIAMPGTGYLVGDVQRLMGGNIDAVIRVTAVSGGTVTAAQILYGGTGYTNGAQYSVITPPVLANETVIYTGVLTSNVVTIFPAGTYLTASRQVIYCNNTTGAFTFSVFLSNGAGGTTGNGIVLPQGTNNSTALLAFTDGVNDIWPVS